ncbi:MAG: hypothetical protein ABIV26_07475 [Candidatus Limnocylindrales bacterium]
MRGLRPLLPSLVLGAIGLVGCSPMAGFGASIHRDGSVLQVTMPGRGEPDARGWLCPQDPGPGETWTEAGAARLEAAGCLDLGSNRTAVGAAPTWLGSVDLATIDPSRLAAFAGKTQWQLIVATGGSGSGQVTTSQIAAVALEP